MEHLVLRVNKEERTRLIQILQETPEDHQDQSLIAAIRAQTRKEQEDSGDNVGAE